MKQFLPTLLLFLLAATLFGQDEAIFNHYVQSPILINPAAAGFNDEYQAQVNVRASWSGFDDAPKTVAARLNGPVGQSFGLGATLLTESAAQQQRTKGQLDVAFRFPVGKVVRGVAPIQMAFGFFTEFERVSINNDILNNQLIQPGDEVLGNYIDGENFFDAGVGIYSTFLENTFAGVTINNLVSNRLNNISGGSQGSSFNYTLALGHSFMLGKTDVKLTPSVLFRNIQDAPLLIDLNLQAGFLDDQLIAGLSYRNLRAMGLLLGTRLRNLKLYYSYDLSFAEFQSYSNGSHELTAGFSISRASIKARREAKALEARNAGRR